MAIDDHDSTNRSWWVIDLWPAEGIQADASADWVCQQVLAVLAPRLRRVFVDAPDWGEDLPPAAQRAAVEIRSRRQRDPMDIELDLARPRDRALLSDFATWSLELSLRDNDARDIGTIKAGGETMILLLSTTEIGQIQAVLPAGVTLNALA